MNWTISGGTVLSGEAFEKTTLSMMGDRLVAGAATDGGVIDATGLLVLPGIVDIHGDGFERQIMPRPGVRFDVALALRDTDRQLVANGITTAFHGVTVSWEPGLRSLGAAEEIASILADIRDDLSCDTRLHIRWETFALEELSTVIGWLRSEPKPIVALNDHTTSTMRKGHTERKLGQWAERCGLTREVYVERLHAIWERREAVPAAIARLAAAARDNGNVLLAHDETSPEERRHFRALGAASSEFPMNLDTARAAREAGEHVILGAPNVVRGGSHNGALDATSAIRDGLCTVLASDYHYPSPFHAAFKLAGRDHADLARSWKLVSENPASAAGLSDRGRLAPGARADLILVDPDRAGGPAIVATFCGGRLVHATRALSMSAPMRAAVAAA